MNLALKGHTIEQVLIVDDQPDSRDALGELVKDSYLLAIEVEAPVRGVDDLRKRASANAAVLCDYHLRKKNYASVDGGLIVAGLNAAGVPAILCSRMTDDLSEDLRPHRKFIPVVIPTAELSPETLLAAINTCIAEIEGRVAEHRRPWRTLVRIEDLDDSVSGSEDCMVVVPGWDPQKLISIHLRDLPPNIQSAILGGADHLLAEVNLGAVTSSDLYFAEWREV